MGGLYCLCKLLVKWFCIFLIDYVGDFWYGEEYWVVV